VIPAPMLLLMMQMGGGAAGPSEAPWPTTKPGRVISSPDWSDYRIYPMAARVNNEEGRVLPEVLVGKDGVPQDCRIVSSSNFPDLDAGSCHLMLQMRFEPARDEAGHPVPSRYSRPLIWLLSDPRSFSSSTIKARLTIAGGREKSCKIVGGDGPLAAAWTGLGCAIFSDVEYYFGKSAPNSLEATIEVRLDAGDKSPFLDQAWPSGKPIAEQKIAFDVDDEGSPSGCTPVESRGFGPRGMNNLSPCGGLLSSIWFEDPPPGTPTRKGFLETRVYVLEKS